ncbi:hypothetical protein BDF20DRAFT_858032 [Mycotypha africana]|uniref:uncharacterized protein n=1 Tax=Mycotypha africana TaxID=64632 RepID=UPI002301DB2D|nr:uncharacterized protein BDF20DRAFT_858032 [Mycotypha africana]KAI8984116.1 hypothetical protein BDF20DRAFT_858032 [Mycotypha africana]
MALCRDDILASLSSSIQQDIIRPIDELQAIVKQIQNTIVKRNRKQVDYDRYRQQLNKLLLNHNTKYSMSHQEHTSYKQQHQWQKEQLQYNHDEKLIFKVQAQLETATVEYDTLNQSLKDQLPIFFHFFQYQVIQPIFERLYTLQHAFYYTLSTYWDDLMLANENYFTTQKMSEDEITKQLATLEIFCLDKTSSSKILNSTRKSSGNTMKNRLSDHWRSNKRSNNDILVNKYNNNNSNDSLSRHSHLQQEQQQQADIKATTDITKPVAPLKSSSATAVGSVTVPTDSSHYATALHNFEGLTDDDLSFKIGDRIKLLHWTEKEDDWWIGQLGQTVGVFPGSYVTY